ncbi:MAG: helix-turn-helix domain-containing protein [Pseudomonadota bacterium]
MPNFALIAYDGVQMSAVLGLADMFDVANRFAEGLDRSAIQHTIVEPTHWQDRFDPQRGLGSGLPSGSASGPDANLRFDVVVLPPNLGGGRGNDDRGLHAWIARQHHAGATICSACAGAFWLGHAGVLDARPVTTHWALEGEFAEAFPSAILHPEHVLIDDHDIVTAGGVMAWLDLGVHILRRWMGPDILSKTCRLMLIDPKGREQRNYRSFQPNLAHTDDAVRSIQRWMEKDVAGDLSVVNLAERAGMSTRTFQRRFTEATKLAPNTYVQHLRVERAKGYLERTSLSVAEVCWRVGYQDVSAFGRLFKSISGLSAGDYRKRFALT